MGRARARTDAQIGRPVGACTCGGRTSGKDASLHRSNTLGSPSSSRTPTNARFGNFSRCSSEAGDHAGAVHVYGEFAERLSTQYGTEPAAETRAMFERSRAGTTNGATRRPDTSLPPPSPSAALPPVESAARPSRIARTLRRRLIAYPLGAVAAGAVAWAALLVLGAVGIGPTASLISSGTLNRQELLVLTDFRLSGVDASVGAAVNSAVLYDQWAEISTPYRLTQRLGDAARLARANAFTQQLKTLMSQLRYRASRAT